MEILVTDKTDFKTNKQKAVKKRRRTLHYYKWVKPSREYNNHKYTHRT